MNVGHKELGKPGRVHRTMNGIPIARKENNLTGKGRRKKRKPLCNGGDRASIDGRDTQAERLLTSETGLDERRNLKPN